ALRREPVIPVRLVRSISEQSKTAHGNAARTNALRGILTGGLVSAHVHLGTDHPWVPDEVERQGLRGVAILVEILHIRGQVVGETGVDGGGARLQAKITVVRIDEEGV